MGAADGHGKLGETALLRALVGVVVIVGEDDEPRRLHGATPVIVIGVGDVSKSVVQRLLDERVPVERLSSECRNAD